MNNSQVAHIWAQQTKASGKGSSFFFEGDTIYSYGKHFPVAKFISSNTVLVTTRGYSITTCRHISLTQSALHGLPLNVFHVDNVLATDHRDNWDKLNNEFQLTLVRIVRARTNAEFLIELANNAARHANDYAAFFNIESVELLEVPADFTAIKSAAKIESAAKKLANKKRNDERAAQLKQSIADWRAGNCRSIYSKHTLPTMLRLSANRELIETSRGAHIPASFAPMIWKSVTHFRAIGTDWKAEQKISIGDFTLDAINENGDIKAGCHNIAFAEIELIAKELGYV